jgi:glyoxylase-like metal-dependent hydrolase (beta-lactamase superfamily II)
MTTTNVPTSATTRTAAELYAALIASQPLFILDVRNEEDFARWRVEGRAGLETLNIPYFEFIEDEDAAVARVPRDRDILVVCAKEGSSEYVTDILRNHGLSAAHLEGGIVTWGDLYDVRDIAANAAGRIVQIARPARGDVSFMIISDGQAAIIDPLRHTDYYLETARQADASVTHIFDTHVHADHISGGPALAQATGAPYYVHAYDAIHPIDMLPAQMPYEHLQDGQTFTIGQYTIKVIWFPGHTLGQVNYLATAPDGQSYLFTGDGIFLKSFGRPDLGGKGETWTPILYESIYERLPQHIDDSTVILPSHFSLLDEDDGQGRFAAPYGQVRRQNDALVPRSKEEFTAYVLGNLPVFPPQYVEIKRVNIGLVHPTEEQASELELGRNICALSQ